MNDDAEPHEETIHAIRQAERAGDYLSAFDQATRAIERHPNDEHLKYLAVRAIARAGSPFRAEALYQEYGLRGSDDVDIASLEARLAKDHFLLTPQDKEAAKTSARLYEDAFERTGDPFPGINAATMWTLAGETDRSQGLAQDVLEICAGRTASSPEERYWLYATLAEGALLLRDARRAEDHLRQAARHAAGNRDATASTARQLRLVCEALNLDADVLDILPRSDVVFYAGHMIAAPGVDGRFPAALERPVSDRIRDAVARSNAEVGFGSLASGADILFAEALLDRGGEVNVVLPFEMEEFKRISVAPAAGDWLDRFDACIARAASVTYATRGSYLEHDVLFGYAAKIAMGLARIRSRALESRLRMLAVWDGVPARGTAGTAVDIAYWRTIGLDEEIIEIEGGPGLRAAPPPVPVRGPETPRREILPVLFGDIKGFSGLQEQHLPVFNAEVLTALARTIHGYGDNVLFTNTWGDAVHVVFADIVSAARCALEMQETLAEIDFRELELPREVGMRISLHIGPVFIGNDPINREETYFGRTLTRAARMEPITPVGEVYVTEQFAALIEMERGDRVHCTYVGDVPLAKEFGNLRMYRLERRPT